MGIQVHSCVRRTRRQQLRYACSFWWESLQMSAKVGFGMWRGRPQWLLSPLYATEQWCLASMPVFTSSRTFLAEEFLIPFPSGFFCAPQLLISIPLGHLQEASIRSLPRSTLQTTHFIILLLPALAGTHLRQELARMWHTSCVCLVLSCLPQTSCFTFLSYPLKLPSISTDTKTYMDSFPSVVISPLFQFPPRGVSSSPFSLFFLLFSFILPCL